MQRALMKTLSSVRGDKRRNERNPRNGLSTGERMQQPPIRLSSSTPNTKATINPPAVARSSSGPRRLQTRLAACASVGTSTRVGRLQRSRRKSCTSLAARRANIEPAKAASLAVGENEAVSVLLDWPIDSKSYFLHLEAAIRGVCGRVPGLGGAVRGHSSDNTNF